MRRSISAGGLVAAGVDVAFVAWYAFFAVAHARAFLAAPRLSLVLVVAMETLFGAFLLLRRRAGAIDSGPFALAVTVAGTLLPTLLRPTGSLTDSLAGQILQGAGAVLALAAILSLNRSIGVLPANRGIRTGGAYRLMRHPLYAAYALLNIGYVVSNLDATNVSVCLAAFGAQLLRIRAEEKLLLRDEDYADYARRTPWRLLPLVY